MKNLIFYVIVFLFVLKLIKILTALVSFVTVEHSSLNSCRLSELLGQQPIACLYKANVGTVLFQVLPADHSLFYNAQK